jgi:septation ring formation regulator EzrA
MNPETTPTPKTDAQEYPMKAVVPVDFCRQLEREVARLRERLEKAEDLIRQAEIEKLHTENVCLQELIQEFYEWSRRDYPTEAEVREIMDRYFNLLNHNPNNKPS